MARAARPHRRRLPPPVLPVANGAVWAPPDGKGLLTPSEAAMNLTSS